jgi:hypothetical protein
MKLELITELIESRMFRNETAISRLKPQQLAEYFYVGMLYLNAMRHANESAASNYAQSTLHYSEFDSVKSSATDLYNLAAGALQDRQFPELAFKRWLRDIVADRRDSRQDYQLFTDFENVLKIDSAGLRGLRRISLYYPDYSPGAQKNFWTTVTQYMKSHMQTVDLLVLKPKI